MLTLYTGDTIHDLGDTIKKYVPKSASQEKRDQTEK